MLCGYFEHQIDCSLKDVWRSSRKLRRQLAAAACKKEAVSLFFMEVNIRGRGGASHHGHSLSGVRCVDGTIEERAKKAWRKQIFDVQSTGRSGTP